MLTKINAIEREPRQILVHHEDLSHAPESAQHKLLVMLQTCRHARKTLLFSTPTLSI